MTTCHQVRSKLSKKYQRQLQKRAAQALETERNEEAELPAEPEECRLKTLQEDKMAEQTEERNGQAVQPQAAAQAEKAAMAEDCHDGALQVELDENALDNMAMNFLEGAEAQFTYHQAELIRLAYLGLNTEYSIQAAQFMLERARRLAPKRPMAKKIDDPFNEYISDFIEQASGHLSFIETEIIRRAARGCDSESIDELQYLLNRARKALHEHTAAASQPLA